MMMAGGGDSIYLRIFNAMLLLLLGYLTNNYTQLFKKAKNWWCSTQQCYTVTAYLSFQNNILNGTDISLVYQAVQDYIYDVVTNKSSDNKIDFEIIEHTKGSEDDLRIVCLAKNKSHLIAPNIYVRQKVDHRDSVKDDKEFVTYTYEIFTYPKNFQVLRDFLNGCLEAYKQKKIDSFEQHVFVLKEFNRKCPFYTEYPLETYKTFNNLFFTQKAELIARVDNFTNNKAQYELTGMPYTCGFLFHGEPGGGKTSTIKALARYTNRHIVQIHLGKITTREELKAVFLNLALNCVEVPNSKRLYVFEEIDCGAWKALFTRQPEPPVQGQGKKQGQKNEDRDKITLGDFLEMLDGIVEISGRMIVMTTNNIMQIDPALMRPGRIDMVVEFGKMTPNDISQMYVLWFNKPFPCDVAKINVQMTQAELGNLFSSHNQEKIVSTLCATSV